MWCEDITITVLEWNANVPITKTSTGASDPVLWPASIMLSWLCMWAHIRYDRWIYKSFCPKLQGLRRKPGCPYQSVLVLICWRPSSEVMCAEDRSALRQINGQEVLGIRLLRSTWNNKDDRCLLVHGFIQFYLSNTVTVCLFQRRS